MAKSLQHNALSYTNYTSTQPQEVAKLLSFTKKPEGYRKEYVSWKNILRANAKTKTTPTFKNQHLGRSAQNLLAPIIQKLIIGERVILNHKYISSITGTGQRQNKNIIKELSGVLDVKYHRSVVANGKKRTRSYEFSFKAGTLEESKVTEENLENPTGKFISHHYTKENNNIENIRSITRASQASFSQNPNSNNSTDTAVSVDTIKNVSSEGDIVVTDSQSTPTVVPIQRNHRPPNKRKKPTNASMKAKIINLTFYSKPKNLGQMHDLLDTEICNELRSNSGRDFSNNFISQRILSFIKKPNITASFKTKQGFISYMTSVLQREFHDATKTSGAQFRLRVNLTAEDRQYNAQEKFLNSVEQIAITQVCPENQLKSKIAGRLESSKAYGLLSRLKRFEVVGEVMRIHLTRSIELTENDRDIILSQVQAVYSTVSGGNYECIETIEFVIPEGSIPVYSSSGQNATQQGLPALELQKGIWGEISQKLIEEFGENTYRNWFSKLTSEVNGKNNTLQLKASSEFIADWVRINYERALQRIVNEFGLELQQI